jgi:hypothetical protein
MGVTSATFDGEEGCDEGAASFVVGVAGIAASA